MASAASGAEEHITVVSIERNDVSLQVGMTVFNNSTAANDSVERDERLTEQLIESVLAVYVMPVIIAAGTVGNLTSLAVLLRRRMRRTSVYLYLTALALADVGVLYVSAFKTWIRLVRNCICVGAVLSLSHLTL